MAVPSKPVRPTRRPEAPIVVDDVPVHHKKRRIAFRLIGLGLITGLVSGGVKGCEAGAEELPLNTYESVAGRCISSEDPLSTDGLHKAIANSSLPLRQIHAQWEQTFSTGGEGPVTQSLSRRWDLAATATPIVIVQVKPGSPKQDETTKRMYSEVEAIGAYVGTVENDGVSNVTLQSYDTPVDTIVRTPVVLCNPENRDVFPIDMSRQDHFVQLRVHNGQLDNQAISADLPGWSNPYPLPAGSGPLDAGVNVEGVGPKAWVIMPGYGSTTSELLPISGGGVMGITPLDGGDVKLASGEWNPWDVVIENNSTGYFLNSDAHSVYVRSQTTDSYLRSQLAVYGDAPSLTEQAVAESQSRPSGSDQRDQTAAFYRNTLAPKKDMTGKDVSLPAPELARNSLVGLPGGF